MVIVLVANAFVAHIRRFANIRWPANSRWAVNIRRLANSRWLSNSRWLANIRRVAHTRWLANIRRVAHTRWLANIRRVAHIRWFANIRRVAHTRWLANIRPVAHIHWLANVRRAAHICWLTNSRRFAYIPSPANIRRLTLPLALASIGLFAADLTRAADIYDAAVQHAGRSANDRKRDALDHPAEILRLAGIKPGMRVLDFMASDGYYSELLSYVVGPTGHVVLMNNRSFDNWSNNGWEARLAHNRLPNVEHQTVDPNHLELADGSLDAVFLVKVYHDLYWVDEDKQNWPDVNTKAVLEKLARALKPGGTLVLVDHSAKPGTGSSVAGSLHRMDEAYAVKDFESHGLKLVNKSDTLRRADDPRTQVAYKEPILGKTDRFVLVFRK